MATDAQIDAEFTSIMNYLDHPDAWRSVGARAKRHLKDDKRKKVKMWLRCVMTGQGYSVPGTSVVVWQGRVIQRSDDLEALRREQRLTVLPCNIQYESKYTWSGDFVRDKSNGWSGDTQFGMWDEAKQWDALQAANAAMAAAEAAAEQEREEEAVDAFLESDSEEGVERDSPVASAAAAPLLPPPKRQRADPLVSIPRTIVARVREWTRRLRRDSRLRQRMLPLINEEQRGRCVGFWVDGVNQCRWRETPVPTAAQQVDHKTRVADGGSDERANLQMMCACCHAMKTAEER